MQDWSDQLFMLLLYMVRAFLYRLGLKMSYKAHHCIGESGLNGTLLLPTPSVPAITSTAAIDAIAAALLATPLHTVMACSNRNID